jgi:crotonobetainyl-CoA:carnitine CoA-transferase CaiB-like acyl-CoA transferase
MAQSNDRPLSGIKVVELAMWVAGPSCSAVLGDWGADVIKLEDPVQGDPIRGAVTTRAMAEGSRIVPPFELDNRNKRSVGVDLRRAEGVEFAMRLIERADVFVTSLRFDTLARMKLDYPSTSARNPRLVYASLNGYGHRGPDRNRPAFDYAAAWARAGLMHAIAEPGEAPSAQRPAMIDHPAGLGLAGAISAALFQRTRTGRGCEVHISLFQMGLWMNATDLTIGLITGTPPEPESRHERANPMWNYYRCRDGGWIYFVMVQADKFWEAFCAALDHPEWQHDQRFKDFGARRRNSRELTRLIADAVASRDRAEWAPAFDRHQLIWAPVQTEEEVLRDAQAQAVGAFVDIEHPNIPGCRVVNSPIEFGPGPHPPYRHAPELGAHTEEVALEAGMTWEDLAKLKDAGVIS